MKLMIPPYDPAYYKCKRKKAKGIEGERG